MLRRLDILVHALDPYDERHYLVRRFIQVWEAQGIACHVRRGVDEPRRADAVLLHVDLTRVPDDYLAAARSYPIGINVAVADVSKRRISDAIVQRGDGYRGRVIVKTDLNTAGGPEALHEIRRRLRRRLEAGRTGPDRIAVPAPFSGHAYPIYSSPDRVPAGFWKDSRLVVERFQPEMQEGFYCLRQWLFLGDQEAGYLSFSRHPIVKANRLVRWEPLDDVPPDLRERRRRLGFDYGKFDYAIVDGRAVLYDANRTPVGRANPTDLEVAPRLAQGISALLPR